MFSQFISFRPVAVCAALLMAAAAPAAEIRGAKSQTKGLKPENRQPVPVIAPASPEAENNLKRIKVPAGLRLNLWAAEPMLANPVAFGIDERGRVFVSETYRYRTSALDIRHYMFMLEDDLAARTVDDRVALSKRHFGKQFDDLQIESEIVRLLEDRTGSGVASFSSIYADKFNSALDGIASGVLARRDKVWFTNIPELWLLQGTDAQGRAKSRKSLSHGYGVRFSFTGHDLHGLVLGPDGKLYFTMGDRGATVKTKEGKTLAYPDEGAVFRCNPDGTGMEVIYRGLRNPQELAFDDYGNLFTGDNDFDHGDEERLVYIVEGGDSGWRVGFQHSLIGFDYVPWKSEEIWMSHNSRQADYNGKPLDAAKRVADTGRRPAAYLPPISNVGDGPSGLTYYSGGGALPSKYAGKFFLAHFKGAVSTSKIQTFRVQPRGAGFVLADSEELLGQCQPTDVDFGPDGALYFADWGEGWERTAKGRIYRLYDETLLNSAPVREAKTLLNTGMTKRSEAELVKLLAHANRWVRQEAQFALVERKAATALSDVARGSGVRAPQAPESSLRLSRLHAIWGLGQLLRNHPPLAGTLLPLVSDADAEVRAQAARVLGDGRAARAVPALVRALGDDSARVRFHAAQALGKIGRKEAVPALRELLRANADADAFLRHAAATALARIDDRKTLLAAARDPSAAVRLGVLLALRQLESPDIAVFLSDKEPQLVLEAARAINDLGITRAMPTLAKLARPTGTPDFAITEGKAAGYDPLMIRAINAAFRVGGDANAKALASLAATGANPAMQVEALTQLASWGSPHPRDRVIGIYRPLKARDARPAVAALKPVIADILRAAPPAVRIAAAQAAGRLALTEAAPVLFEVVADTAAPSPVRGAALEALAALKDRRLAEAIQLAKASPDATLRRAANTLLAQAGTESAVAELARVIENGTLTERQGALATLAAIPGAAAGDVVTKWVDLLVQGKAPAGLALDILEAGARRNDTVIASKLMQYRDSYPAGDDLAGWRETLAGGDAAAGRRVFFERTDTQCFRCHKIGDEGGGEVGPNLAGLAARVSREYLLEAIVHPNKAIAAGFDSVTVVLKDGRSVAGILKAETPEQMSIFSLEDNELVTVKTADVAQRAKGLSGMPEGLAQMLSKPDLRDLIEFLGSLK
jgi:putative membrane-bound dehydrogenase-like protein